MATFTSTPNKEYYVRLIVNQTSQNIANNTSTVSWELWVGNGVNTMQYNGQQLSASINGKTVHSSTQQITLLSRNMTVKIASGTETISHNADGTKTIACSGQWIPTGSYAPSATLTASGNLQLTTIPRASSVSLASSEVAYGSRLTININRATSSFTHDVTIKLPNRTQTYTGVATQQLFDIPLEWLNGYTNGLRASGTVTVQTKSGSTNIGSAVSVNFASPVPSNIVPTLSVARTAFNSGLAGFNEPIQGVSTMTLTRTAGGTYGSTITKTEWWGEGINPSSSSAVSFTAMQKNPQYIYCKVTDSRGRTGQVTYTSWNWYYSPPSMSVTAYRCNSSGVADNEGQYIRFTQNFTVENVGGSGLNTVSSTMAISGGVLAQTALSNPSSGALKGPIGDNKILKTSAYTLTCTLTDKVGKTTTATANIPVSEVLMNFPSSANALGIGMYSQGANRLDIGWDTNINGTLKVNGVNVPEGLALTSSTNLNDVNGRFLGTNVANVNATPANNYPLAEAGSLIAITAAYASANQIYHTFNSNRMFIRGGGPGVSSKTSWVELLHSNNYNSLITSLNLSTLTVSGETDAGTSLKADTIGVDNADGTNGKGISLWNGANTGAPNYGLFFGGTATFGTHANTDVDFATYFTMQGNNGRGWIFRNMTTGQNVASINNVGTAYFGALRYDSYPMSNTNLNDHVMNGVYQGYAGMTNAPVQDISLMIVYRYSNDWVVQRFYNPKNTGAINVWERCKYSGTTWSSWVAK